jgi:hypothetical protein
MQLYYGKNHLLVKTGKRKALNLADNAVKI